MRVSKSLAQCAVSTSSNLLLHIPLNFTSATCSSLILRSCVIMACPKVFMAFLVTLTSLLYLSDAADLVAPNSLGDGQSLQEGDFTFLNQGCTLTKGGDIILQSPSVEGSCGLTMRADGELVEARDSDGLVSYTSQTVSVLGGVVDSYKLHLDGNIRPAGDWNK